MGFGVRQTEFQILAQPLLAMESRATHFILQNLRLQKMGIIPKVIGKVEKQHIKHVAQCLTHSKLSNNHVFVFIEYC